MDSRVNPAADGMRLFLRMRPRWMRSCDYEWQPEFGWYRCRPAAHLVDAIDAVIYEADLAGWVKFVNRRAVDLLGYPRRRWLSQPSFWQAITYCDDRSKVTDHFALCAKDGQRRELEYRLVAANGRIVWVRESLAASLDGPADDHLLP